MSKNKLKIGGYTLKNIDRTLWRRVKAIAALEGMTVGNWIAKTLEEKVYSSFRNAYQKGQIGK